MGHHHHYDQKDSSSMRITLIGAAVNIAFAALKGGIGIMSGSAALVADGAHSLSDLFSDGVTVWAVRKSNAPSDKEHPYGHGKFESVASFIIALLLILTGLGIVVHAFNHLEAPSTPGKWAIVAALLSIGAKESLYQVTAAIGKRIGSRALIANAWHHRTDALSSVAALIGVLGAQLGFAIMDPIAGVLVAGLICKTGVDILNDSLRDLTDESVDERILEQLHEVLDNVQGVVDYHEVRARRMGSYILVDLHLQVEAMSSVSVAHQVAERVRWKILNTVSEVNEVLIHVDAEDDLDKKQQVIMRPQKEIEHDIHKLLEQIPEVTGCTHILCHYLNEELKVQIEVIMDPALYIHEAQSIAQKTKEHIEEIKDIENADIHLELLHHPS